MIRCREIGMATRDDGGGTSIRCNASRCYVEPAFRNYGP
jgi:hypothetical protein